jgi:TIR domain/SIR2-like domain
MKERYWTNLVSSLRHRRCILVLGPEVRTGVSSYSAGDAAAPPTYADALKVKLIAELEEDGRRVTATNLAGVAQQYEDADGFGSNTLRSQAARFYDSAPLEPSAVHKVLALLPFPLIISTCHDRLLADALKQAEKTPVVYRYNLRGDRGDNPEFAVSGAEGTPVVYHLFGTFEEPQSLVLSENDLLDFLIAVISERPPMPNSLRRALQRPGVSLLFVGFGIRHWYLRVLLKALVRSLLLGGSGGAVALEPLLHEEPEFDRQQTILFYQRGTRVEVCGDDIPSFVAELQRRLAAEGGVSAGTMPIGKRLPVFVSYASEDRALAARLFASLQSAGFEPWLDKDALRGGEDWNLMIEDQLRESDYVLVLETPALAGKRVGYVNKEIAIARDQAQRYRGSFLVPLEAGGLSPDQRIAELGSYQHLPLRESNFDDDIAALVSTLRRDYQRRQRERT